MSVKSQKPDSLLTSAINLDLELNDVLARSMVNIKFVALKTPSTASSAMPEKLFFTFKFFTFKTIQTDVVNLHFETEIKPAC